MTAILDRMCKVMPEAEKMPVFKSIKYWSTDLWHGEKHNKKCKCNPHVHLRLKRRLSKVNSSAAEQLRGYAKTFNEFRPERHRFLMLYSCGRHNQLVSTNYTGHLKTHSHRNSKKRQSKLYHCQEGHDEVREEGHQEVAGPGLSGIR